LNYRNVVILFLCQALAMSSAPMILFIGPIIGLALAPTPSLSTLPMAIMILGVASFTIPASMLMKRIGRQRGFICALGVAIIAELGAIYALNIRSFALFSVMMWIIGGNVAFIQQYRFAAAESVEPQFVSRAVSWVLLGGVFSGFIGPFIGNTGKNLLSFGDFTGSFIILVGVHLITIVLFLGLKDVQIKQTTPAGESTPSKQRPLREIITARKYMLAVLAGAIGYAVMALIMTATPISMHKFDGFSLGNTAIVIQSHVVAMYLPSLIAGYLIDRFGVYKVMLTGVFCLLGCVVINLGGQLFWGYWSSLVLLGIGWNFTFLGGTILLTKCYNQAERFKAQAVNDFTIFAIQAVASLLSGTLFYLVGWQNLNLIGLPLLGGLLFALFLTLRLKITTQPVTGQQN